MKTWFKVLWSLAFVLSLSVKASHEIDAHNLSGDWNVTINTATFILRHNSGGNYLRVKIDNHGQLGGGSGTLDPVGYNQYDGFIYQQCGNNCWNRFHYAFNVVNDKLIEVFVDRNDGNCGVSPYQTWHYYIYR